MRFTYEENSRSAIDYFFLIHCLLNLHSRLVLNQEHNRRRLQVIQEQFSLLNKQITLNYMTTADNDICAEFEICKRCRDHFIICI